MTKTFSNLALLSALLSASFLSQSASISQQQVISDVTYLASDELKGRASFSPEIDKAADFIAQSFKQANLVPLPGSNTYKQSFNVHHLKVSQAQVSLNKRTIAPEDFIVVSSLTSINWQNDTGIKQLQITEQDDFRTVMNEINLAGDNAIVYVHPSHSEIFERYHHYLNQGVTKLSLNHQAALVLIKTAQSEVNNIEITAQTKINSQTLTNLVGVLPGKSDSPKTQKEIVLFSAHYDHLGEKNDEGTVAIYNGADDDASGTTAIMNLARYFSTKGDNQRTLMFAAFTAEEIGGYGSKYFSEQLNPEDVVAMLNIEMIGKESKFGAGTFWMTGFERSDLGSIINKDLHTINQQVYPDPYPEQQLFYRSDNATLARLGVPAHSFSSTQLDKDQHYHQASDDIDSLNLNSMTQVIESLAIGSQSLVDGSKTPSRVDTSTVRAKGLIY